MDAAGEVWQGLTGERLRPAALDVSGEESVLPGPFRVAEAAAAAIGVATLAAAELLRLTGIEPGRVSVDRRHAAAAFRSERYLRVDGEPPGDVWAALSGDYRAADGWVRLHCNYPRHADAACRALNAPHEREAVTAAVARRTAWDVQESVIAEGGAAAAMRGRQEWRDHPQGRALAAAPLVDLAPIAPAPARAVARSDRPLGGVRVLELTHVIAGPVAGRALAAHGADVLHIGAAHLPVVPPLVIDTGLGKRSARLDLRTPADRDRLWRLVGEADVFVQSFRPGALARRGFSAENLARARPGIVVVDLGAYGWEGPWATRRGFDSLVQMASGIAAEGGARCREPGRPVPLPAQALDHATGWLAAAAAMTALRRRAVEGGSWRARLSLARTGWWLDSLGRQAAGAVGAVGAVDVAADPPELDVSGLLVTSPSPFGEVTHVRVPGALPAANPGWAHGPHLPGSDPAQW
ncbi:MAG TPA: CoA transferase [Amycolatopsis sp.]|nr:CoA transferase [Amycolatopsis sp.]